jgi:hypothetical protein
VLLAVLAVYLAVGEKPWAGGIAERIAEGRPLRPIDYARTYGWWMALANAGALAVALATLRRWIGPARVEPLAELAPPPRAGRGLRLAVLAAMALLALLGAPRLSQSLWGDEKTSLHRGIWGVYGRSEAGDVAWLPLKWRETFWNYAQPDNHVPFSILARCGLELREALVRPDLHFVDERVLRAPAYLAGIAAIAATAALLHRLGFAWAAGFAAFLLALHPWHLRYTTEARGYSILLLLVPAALWLLVEALHRGTWRAWLGYALAQTLLLWTYPGALHVLVVQNAVAAAGVLWLHRGRASFGPQATRFAVASLASALLWLQLMLPNMMQLAVFLRSQVPVRPHTARFAREVLSLLWTGTPLGAPGANPAYPELADVAAAHPWAFAAAAAATALLVAAGAVRLLAAGRARALLVPALLLPAPLALAFAAARGYFLYPWYLIFALPAFAVLLALGLAAALPREGSRRARALTAAGMLAYLAVFAWLTQPARHALRARSLQPLRESVRLMRPDPDPFSAENERILTAAFETHEEYYDPRSGRVDTAKDLRRWMRRADAEDRPFFVHYGGRKLARRRHPDVLALVEREDLFEPVATLRGFEPKYARYVLRYRGRAGRGRAAPPPE